ncbi:hypothetical protein LguiA_002351 [Lonicera macranthoides]
MEEHQGSSVDVARQEVIKKIMEAWRRLNKECLLPNPFSRTFTKASLNLARMVPLMYSYDENHDLPDLEEHAQGNADPTVPYNDIISISKLLRCRCGLKNVNKEGNKDTE